MLLKSFARSGGFVPHTGALALSLLAVSLFLAPANAQVASISGRVIDSTGAGVSDAMITVKNTETGAVRTTTTDMTGSYRVTSLSVGAHEVRAEKAMFKTTVRNAINIVVGQDAVVNFSLELGPVTESITVTDEVPVVNTTTSQVFGLVSERQVKDLPLNGRSFDKLDHVESQCDQLHVEEREYDYEQRQHVFGGGPASAGKYLPVERD
ncbi:MAG: carboxypeptidase-like regulatory domain-containing protein [Acidobacteriota bacterium]